jgi:hypothetical protein
VLLHHVQHAVLDAVPNTRAILAMTELAVARDLLLVRRHVVTSGNGARQRAKVQVHGFGVDAKLRRARERFTTMFNTAKMRPYMMMYRLNVAQHFGALIALKGALSTLE